MRKILIGIYDDESTLLVNITETIEEAAKWIGTGTSTLYDNLHRLGVMKAKGFTVERVAIAEEDKKDETL